MDEPNVLIGIAWYRPDQYALLRALAVDSDSMADTYEQWLAGVTKTIDDLRQRGVVARKVNVDINDLVAWCQQRKKPLNGAARSEYVTEKLQ